MDWIGVLLPCAAAALAVGAAALLAGAASLRGAPMCRSRVVVDAPERLPAAARERLSPARQALESMGFRARAVLRRGSLHDPQVEPVWMLEFDHPNSPGRAVLSAAPGVAGGPRFAVCFVTTFATGATLATVNFLAHTLYVRPRWLRVEDANAPSLEAQWRHHESLAASRADGRRLDVANAAACLERQHDDSLDALLTSNLGESAGPGSYRLRRWPALVAFLRLFIGNLRLARDPVARQWASSWRDSAAPDVAQLARAASSLRVRFARWTWDCAWLAMAVAAFVLVLGHAYGFDDRLLQCMLVAVSLYKLAQWAVVAGRGYRACFRLFIPALGPFAPSPPAPERDPLPLAFAGALPGIALAWASIGGALAMGATLDGESDFVQLVSVLLLWNTFVLLPVGPLDGGRLVARLLYSRLPRLRPVIEACWLVVVAWVAVSIDALALLLPVMVLALFLPGRWQLACAQAAMCRASAPAAVLRRAALAGPAAIATHDHANRGQAAGNDIDPRLRLAMSIVSASRLNRLAPAHRAAAIRDVALASVRSRVPGRIELACSISYPLFATVPLLLAVPVLPPIAALFLG